MIYEFNKILDQAEVDKNAEEKEVIREEDKKKKKAITEAYKKSSLPNNSFGLPDVRKYPLHDKKHVASAIKMFNYVDEKDEKELAENIIKKIKEYHMTDLDKYIVIGEKNRFRSYWGVDKHINETSIKEDAYEKPVLKPIYIVTVYTGTAFGKVITAVTGDTYSHAAIGFDSSLDDLYSFNAASNLGKRGGLSKESLTGYRNENPDGDLQVATVFVKERDYNILQERLDWLKEHASETFYDFSNILNIIFRKTKGSVNQLSMVCSEFVEYLFNLINVDLTGKSANLTTPGDLSRIKNPKVYKIFEGKIKHYNVKRMDKRVNQVMTKAEPIREFYIINAITEAKEFPVQFNDDGDLIVKNYKKLNYKEEYYKSVKLLSAYKAVDNMEGIKYELAKTWFLMEVLSKKINSTRTSDQERKEFLEIKKRANNTFAQYLKILGLREPEFNFGEYYKNSPFSDTEIHIAGSTLTHGIKLLKQII